LDKATGRVRSRLPQPLLEPELDWERAGDVNDVVFVQGHTGDGEDVYLTYGAPTAVSAWPPRTSSPARGSARRRLRDREARRLPTINGRDRIADDSSCNWKHRQGTTPAVARPFNGDPSLAPLLLALLMRLMSLNTFSGQSGSNAAKSSTEIAA